MVEIEPPPVGEVERVIGDDDRAWNGPRSNIKLGTCEEKGDGTVPFEPMSGAEADQHLAVERDAFQGSVSKAMIGTHETGEEVRKVRISSPPTDEAEGIIEAEKEAIDGERSDVVVGNSGEYAADSNDYTSELAPPRPPRNLVSKEVLDESATKMDGGVDED